MKGESKSLVLDLFEFLVERDRDAFGISAFRFKASALRFAELHQGQTGFLSAEVVVMVWFWSNESPTEKAPNGAAGQKDIYADLDPELRAFAKSQSTNDREIPRQDQSESSGLDDARSSSSEIPYPEQVDQARLLSKSRKTVVNAAAMFNCAIAEHELSQCFTTGSWWDKAKLCETQKAAFWDCLEGNKKALTILGYGESTNSDALNETLRDKADDLVLYCVLRKNETDATVYEAACFEER